MARKPPRVEAAAQGRAEPRSRLGTIYETMQDVVAFLADYACELNTRFSSRHLVEDKSLVRASGPIRHQKDRKEDHIPATLRHLEATWSKSAYQGSMACT